jgi:hypothetical protein
MYHIAYCMLYVVLGCLVLLNGLKNNFLLEEVKNFQHL